MQKVITRFGTIYIEDLHDREEEDRIKVFDSNQRYLDYYPMETVHTLAKNLKSTPYNVLQKEIEKLRGCDDIECLVTMLVSDWEMYTDDWTDVAERLHIDDEDPHRLLHEVLNNDYVNKIGSYYIVVAE